LQRKKDTKRKRLQKRRATFDLERCSLLRKQGGKKKERKEKERMKEEATLITPAATDGAFRAGVMKNATARPA
jgi:hypothetical protein